ncbi:hypothetical protein Csp1_09370 [Corynebacterium provencense]|uniref:HTH arsR-type domain-containing protein n=1 Tax=Corynebacterium provencense TaxID=1737425 RepID=A0A2Z3YWF7_9CORY|nr:MULTISPECIES: helix-turn-helix transcriptional regulator [Corynebacterium]AWT25743.1 hypothetical protein Csp1_09370 [Corynebacterium provencense]MCI1257494.1 ArsR family transcriptional regulator [Corynebacterium provencense]
MSPARSYEHPDAADITLPRVLFALSDPLRLGMIHRLADNGGEVDSRELGPGLPKSTLTHHTRLLRESGLTWTRGEGRKCLISLRREDLDARFPGLLDTVLEGWRPESGV